MAESPYIKNHITFLPSAGVRKIHKSCGWFGIVCIQEVWKLMRMHGGILDMRTEKDADQIAFSLYNSELDSVQKVIQIAIETGLVSPSKEKGTYFNDRLSLVLAELEGKKAGGYKTQQIRREKGQTPHNGSSLPQAKQKDTSSYVGGINEYTHSQTPKGAGNVIAGGSSTPTPTAPAALWPRLVEIFKIPEASFEGINLRSAKAWCDEIMHSERKDKILALFRDLKEGKKSKWGVQKENQYLIDWIQKDPNHFLSVAIKHKFTDETNPPHPDSV